jgi:hypothetical protein
MAIMRTPSLFLCTVLMAACGCGAVTPKKKEPFADCSLLQKYDFLNYSNFDAGQTGWFLFADATPGGYPDPKLDSNLQVTDVPAPGRCGDTGMAELKAYGHNFYGTGYGDYAHNHEQAGLQLPGSQYEGISFWARSEPNTDKTFMLYVDDGRTIVLPPDAPDAGILPPASAADVDRDGDGVIGPGDVARGTACLLPPPQSLGVPSCYNTTGTAAAFSPRVPAANVLLPDGRVVSECGNQFHIYITTTEDWQLFLIPWHQLVQWPCTNRLDGGIDPDDIREIEIKFLQGTSYDLWLDDIAFYRPRGDGGP